MILHMVVATGTTPLKLPEGERQWYTYLSHVYACLSTRMFSLQNCPGLIPRLHVVWVGSLEVQLPTLILPVLCAAVVSDPQFDELHSQPCLEHLLDASKHALTHKEKQCHIFPFYPLRERSDTTWRHYHILHQEIAQCSETPLLRRHPWAQTVCLHFKERIIHIYMKLGLGQVS